MNPIVDVIIYHNPACGTSRNTLALIRNAGIEPHVVEYLKTPPSREMLISLIARMGIPVRALLREKGTPYADLGLDDPTLTDELLLDAMMAHPILINRPIVVSPKGVRPVSYTHLWALLMPVIVLGGIKFGVFTPTEAAVVAAVYAMFVGMVIYRELKPSMVYGVFLAAAKTTAVVMFLVASALASAWLITSANIPGEISSMIKPLINNPTLLLIAINILVLVVGTALDLTPTILILTPVLMPIIKEAGINPVYFGVLFIMNNCIGLLTPPVGVVLNVVAGVAKVPLGKVMAGVWPFLVAQTIVLFLLILFPEIVLTPLRWLR